MTETIRIPKAKQNWRSGAIRVSGSRYTISVEAVDIGPVKLVYNQMSRSQYRFDGVERHRDNPASEFSGDLPRLVENLPFDAVPRATWKRLYDEDQRRRSYYA